MELNTLNTLISNLSQLRSPSREADEQICDFLWGERKLSGNTGEVKTMLWNTGIGLHLGIAPCFTEDLNTVLQWIMPKNVSWSLAWNRDHSIADTVIIAVNERENILGKNSEARTPAIAFCIAALCAREIALTQLNVNTNQSIFHHPA